MNRYVLALVVGACIQATVACGQSGAPKHAASAGADIVSALSERSGLPASEIETLLQDCNASQTSMNFCAWRDLIVAENELDRVVAERLAKQPTCRDGIEKELASWRRSRDAGCDKSVAGDYGDASMKPMLQAMCKQAETVRMTKRVAQMKGCQLR